MQKALHWPHGSGEALCTLALVALLVVAVAIQLWVIAGLSAGFLVADLTAWRRRSGAARDPRRNSTR